MSVTPPSPPPVHLPLTSASTLPTLPSLQAQLDTLTQLVNSVARDHAMLMEVLGLGQRRASDGVVEGGANGDSAVTRVLLLLLRAGISLGASVAAMYLIEKVRRSRAGVCALSRWWEHRGWCGACGMLSNLQLYIRLSRGRFDSVSVCVAHA
jgi:hypothetical protein